MGLTLQRVELSNIRSHGSFIFEPSETGITAISGPNGAGKSTIVDSVGWCLFGEKPHGVGKTISLMKDGTDLSQSPCSVSVFVNIDKSVLKIERKIVSKAGAVECNVWEKKENETDFAHISGPAVSHTEKYVKKRLGIDSKGFFSAVFVQQKQVDQLISAAPRERAVIIEKLTGISSITSALAEARQQHNTLKKILDMSSVDGDEIESLKKKKEKLLKSKEAEEKTYSVAKDKTGKLKEKVDNISRKLDDAEKNEEKRQKAQELVTFCEATIESKEEELSRIQEKKKTLKNTLSTGSGSLSTVEEALEKERKLLKDLERNLTTVTSKKESLTEKVKACEEVLNRNDGNLEEKLSDMEKELSKTKETIFSRISEIAELKTHVKKIEKAISIISKEKGHCPTCLQTVSNVEETVSRLTKEGERYSARLSICEEELSDLTSLEDRQSTYHEKLEKLFAITSELDSCREEIKNLSGKIEDVSPKVEAKIKEVSSLEKMAEKLRVDASLREEYEELHGRAIIISDTIENTRRKMATAQNVLSSTKKTANIQSMRAEYSKLIDQYQTAMEKATAAKEKLMETVSEISRISDSVDAMSKELEKYREMLKNVEMSSSSITVLEEFRENRVKTSIPTVENYASDLLNRFTDGKMTGMKLDKKFNATVVMEGGNVRPVGLLSGGELSVAAIALRLAISMLLNANSSMMILDEVLVSQDDDRSELILSTIKDVCQGQIIMISHGATANDIADKVVELS